MNIMRMPILVFVCLLALSGCQSPQNQGQMETDGANSTASENTATQIEAETTENDFCMTLYADNSAYSTDDAIQIWATLEYVGSQRFAAIWHGDPYIVFSITDGEDFHVSGLVQYGLDRTILQKGQLYHFDYVKSGGYDTLAPDADFWREFYHEEELKLPAGTYTVSVEGEFYLSEDMRSAEKGPSCSLQITVQ